MAEDPFTVGSRRRALVCYDNYEFSVGPLGGGTWPDDVHIGEAKGETRTARAAA